MFIFHLENSQIRVTLHCQIQTKVKVVIYMKIIYWPAWWIQSNLMNIQSYLNLVWQFWKVKVLRLENWTMHLSLDILDFSSSAQGSWRMDEFGSILSEIAGIGERIRKEEGLKLQHLLLRPHPGCHPPQKRNSLHFSFSWEIASLLILKISVLYAAPWVPSPPFCWPHAGPSPQLQQQFSFLIPLPQPPPKRSVPQPFF